MEKKICTKCGKEKELSEFGFSSNVRKDGIKLLKSQCKSCIKEYKKLNKNKIREYMKEYGLNNKDKIKEYNKKYNKEYMKEYRKLNEDKIKEYDKEYSKKYKNKLKSQELELLNKEFESFVINNLKYYNKKADVWTYIIKSNGFYKIGITNQFTMRMREINKYIPIYEVHRLPINVERRLHLELEDYRFTYDEKFGGYTELFDITDEMASEIIKREHFKKIKKEFDNQ